MRIFEFEINKFDLDSIRVMNINYFDQNLKIILIESYISWRI